MKAHLQRFYAVTNSSSLYEVNIGNKITHPLLIKIESRGNSRFPVGGKMNDGTMLAICKSLILFVPEGSGAVSPMSTVERQISSVNTRYWGGGTSDIVALFLIKKDAQFCIKNHRAENHQTYRKQWEKDTIEVLRVIGNDHPRCSIEISSRTLWLMPPDEWQQ